MDQSPVPQRIGDVERDQAVEYLREHLALGRIDQAEFDERLDVALTARFADDLTPLFADLPAPKPGRPTAAVPPPAPASRPSPGQQLQPTGPSQAAIVLGTLAALAWPIAIVAMLTLEQCRGPFHLAGLLVTGADDRHLRPLPGWPRTSRRTSALTGRLRGRPLQ